MKRNVGEKDAYIRLFGGLGIIVLVMIFMKFIPLAVIIAAYAIALILAATGVIGYCPLYGILRINTKIGHV